MEEDPGGGWTVGAMARAAHLSRAQFTRRCQAEAGMPPARFVIQARIARARHLLRETDMSVGEIAAALHYGDIFHFSHQFKQETAQSPTAYRTQAREP